MIFMIVVVVVAVLVVVVACRPGAGHLAAAAVKQSNADPVVVVVRLEVGPVRWGKPMILVETGVFARDRYGTVTRESAKK
jgi:hypothetical protein